MKLAKRQKIILLIGVGLLFIVILITTSVVIFANRKEPKKTPFVPNPNPPVTILSAQKNEAITEIETAIVAKSINDATLVQKLIAANKLGKGETSWKVYLESSNITDLNELTARKSELLSIISSFGSDSPGSPPIPNPFPGPGGPPGWTPPTSGASGLLDDTAMGIIEREYGLKEIKPDKLEIISSAQAEVIKYKAGSWENVIDEWRTKEIFFLPVNNSTNSTLSGSGGHWSLLVYDVLKKTFHYYDSLGSSNLESGKKLAKNFTEILLGKEEDLPLEIEEAAQQSDGSSCGAFTVAHMKFLMERYRDKGSKLMSWKIESGDKQKVKDDVTKMRKLLKDEGWSDTGTGVKLTDFDSWGYLEAENIETTRLLRNNVGGFTSFQQDIASIHKDKRDS